VKKELVERFGPTEGCQGCKSITCLGHRKHQAAHNPICRERLRQALEAEQKKSGDGGAEGHPSAPGAAPPGAGGVVAASVASADALCKLERKDEDSQDGPRHTRARIKQEQLASSRGSQVEVKIELGRDDKVAKGVCDVEASLGEELDALIDGIFASPANDVVEENDQIERRKHLQALEVD